MLDENKRLFYARAAQIPDWEKKSNIELCNMYLKFQDENNIPMRDACFGALVYRYWKIATSIYYGQGNSKIASPDDCYDWLVESLMYVLEHHVWTNPESSIYGDKNGPDKAMSTKMSSERINFYVANSRQKRKLFSESISLENISEDYEDFLLPTFDRYSVVDEQFENIIKSSFNKKDYFYSFAFDAILCCNMIDTIDDGVVYYSQFNKKRLKRYLNNLNEADCQSFAERHGFDTSAVISASKFVNSLPASKLELRVDRFLSDLKHDKDLVRLCRE